jgi:hypothetical protein
LVAGANYSLLRFQKGYANDPTAENAQMIGSVKARTGEEYHIRSHLIPFGRIASARY